MDVLTERAVTDTEQWREEIAKLKQDLQNKPAVLDFDTLKKILPSLVLQDPVVKYPNLVNKYFFSRLYRSPKQGELFSRLMELNGKLLERLPDDGDFEPLVTILQRKKWALREALRDSQSLQNAHAVSE